MVSFPLHIKPPAFSHEGCTVVKLSNPNHFPNAPLPRLTILILFSSSEFLTVRIQFEHLKSWETFRSDPNYSNVSIA